MSIQIVDKSINREQSRRPLPEIRKRKRIGCLFFLAILAVLFYVAVGCYFAVRYFYPAAPAPVQKVVAAPAEPEYPDLRQKYLKKLVAEAKFCLVDPALTQNIIVTAVEFAKDVEIDPAPFIHWFADLPKARSFADKPVITVKSVHDENPVTWIEVDARYPDGRFVSGLTRVDFELTQGEFRFHRLAIAESVRQGRIGDILMLFDTSGSMTGTPSETMKRAAIEFISRVAPTSRIKLWSFASDVKPISGWSSDPVELAALVRSLTAEGGTSLYKGIHEAVEDASLLDHPATIVLFTDGSDSSPGLPPANLLTKAVAKRIPIHIVGLQTGELKEPILRKIAEQTGGAFYLAERPEQLFANFQAVASKLSTPVYRIAIIEPFDKQQPLSIRVGQSQVIASLK